MSRMEHENWQVQIEDCFSGRLRGEALDALYAHLRDCDECQRVFERFSQAERALGRADGGRSLTNVERDRVRARLFKSAPPEQKSSASLWLGSFVVMTAAIIVAVVAAPRPRVDVVHEQMQPRGSGPALSHTISLRVLRVRHSDSKTAVVGLGEKESVVAGDELRFLYTNLSDFAEGALLIDGPQGRRVLTSKHTLRKAAEDAPFGKPFIVPEDWTEGVLTITAVYWPQEGEKLDPSSLNGPEDSPRRSVRVVRTRIAGGDLRKTDDGGQ